MADQAEIDLWNAALLAVGVEDMTGPDDQREPARRVRSLWPRQRDKLLRAHKWNFALKRAALPAEADPPAFGFSTAYRLPAVPFCLRVLEAVTDATWVVEGRQILTDAAAPLKIRYVARIEDLTLWTADALELAELALAAKLAVRHADSRALAESLVKEYRANLPDARSLDGAEGTPEDIFGDDSDFDFLRSRY